MKKRFWALFLAVMMVVSVLPTTAFAIDGDALEGAVQATKTLVCDDKGKPEVDADGCYTIKLTVQGNPVTTNTRPNADVVLVVDNSGSMASSVGTPCESTTFEKIDTIALSLLGTGFYWDIYECPTCHARYIRSYSKFVGHEVDVFFDTRPPECTGETGEVVRMDAAIAVSKEFASNILAVEGNRIAVIGFAHQENEGGANDTGAIKVAQDLTKDLDVVKSKIDSMEAEGGTNYTAALKKAYDYLNARSDEDKGSRPGYVVFISDGAPGRSGQSFDDPDWNGKEQIAALKNDGITVYTVGIALDDSAANYLKSMASDEQDKHFINVTGTDYQDELSDTLAQWAAQIKKVPAGTNAVMTDIVDISRFTIVDYDSKLVRENDGKLIWNIGDIPEETTQVTITVKAKEGVYGKVHTNENVYLTYTPAGSDTPTTIDKTVIGHPFVNIDAPATYTVTYTANGGTGTTTDPNSPYVEGATVTQVANGFTKAGYTFAGWEEVVADGVAPVTVTEGAFSMPARNVVFQATWTEIPTYTVTYTANGGTGTTTDPNSPYVEGATVTQVANGFTKAGYTFAGWEEVVADGVAPVTVTEGAFSMPARNVVFQATWTPIAILDVEKVVTSVGGTNILYDQDGEPTNMPQAKVGDTIVWTVTVRNTGAAAGYVALADLVDELSNEKEVTFVSASVLADDETGKYEVAATNGAVMFQYSYTVTAADKGLDLINTVTLNNTESESKPVKVENIDVEKVLTGIYAPNSTTAKTGTTAEVGDTIKWTITVTNNGDEAVTIQHPVDKMTITKGNVVTQKTLTAVPKEGDAAAFYTLVAGASKEFTVEYTVLAEDLNAQISNSATVNGVTGSTDGPVNVGATPALSVTKTVNKTSVTVGDKIIYTITVKNTGNVDLTNVEVKDTFVDGGTGKLTVKAGDMKIGTLAVGKEAKIELEYTTTSDDRNGLKNTAMATANGVEGKSSSVDVTVKSEPITPVGPSKPQLNYEDHYAYVVGYPDGLVHPERNITRAEVATIFFRMLLDESREYFWAQENDFSDVAETDWFNNAVSTLANAQLINGYPDGSYRPNANITRAEFATIAIRFFLDEDVEIEENNLSDVKGHWAEANINLAYALELINGYPDGTFRPDQKITRAEAMAIVNRVLKRAPEKDHLLKDMIEWPDNLNTAAWYYADVQEATNSHKFHMDKEEEYEIWTELLPVRDWVALEQEWSKANSSKNPGEVVDIKITTPEAGDNGLKLD